MSTELGTRHRAAIGLSEQTDAVVVVVSEETGVISYTYGGHIYRHLPEDQIKEALRTFMERPRQNITSMWKWGGKNDDSFETQLACKNTFIIGSHRHVGFLLCATKNPVMEVSYTVPVQVQNLAANYIIEDAPQYVRVTLSGPRDTIINLKSENLKAYIDASGVSDGSK